MKVSDPSTRKKMTMKEFAALTGVPYKTFHFRLSKGYSIFDACTLTNHEARSRASTKHGMHGSPEYSVWENMIHRCKAHPHYIKLGITVCEAWSSFENFYRDMGPRPEGLTLEREDGTEGYSPSNCRWATWREQAQNTSRNVTVMLDGEILVAAEVARRSGMPYKRALYRIKHGLNQADILRDSTYGFQRNPRKKKC